MSCHPRPGLLVIVLLTVAATLAANGTALAQQSPQLIAVSVAQVPTDPADPAWQQATAVDVPLTPQIVALPRLIDVSIATVSVRSLSDGTRIAFLLEWADTSRDARASRPDEFRDAAAIMFPLGNFLPNICMGTPGQLTNLWHWKADWQEDMDKGFQDVLDAYPNFYKDSYPFVTGQPPYRVPADFASAEAVQYFVALAAGNPFARPDRSTPIEELIAAGFGTATHKSGQQVTGRGAWADGRWRVLFSRPLAAPDSEAVDLANRSDVPVAFAVWNGSNQEVGARKQLSSFTTLRLRQAVRPPAGPAASGEPNVLAWIGMAIAAGYVLVLIGAGVLSLWWKSRSARRGE